MLFQKKQLSTQILKNEMKAVVLEQTDSEMHFWCFRPLMIPKNKSTLMILILNSIFQAENCQLRPFYRENGL